MFRLTPFKKNAVRRDDENSMYSFQKEMNRVFEDFFAGKFGEFPSLMNEQSFGDISPRVDMSETDKELIVKVELPGMTEKDLELSLSTDSLTISGEKKQEKEESEKGWYKMERQYGSFCRVIPLPYEIESDKVEAQFRGGVLTVRLPKTAVQQKACKTIPVKSV